MQRAIKSIDQYQRRVWTSSKTMTLSRRGSMRTLDLGDEFCIRPAKSDPGSWRVVFDGRGHGQGETYVYSIKSSESADLVFARSQAIEEE